MGAVYLTYSAYFLSVDFVEVYTIMNFIVAIGYFALIGFLTQDALRVNFKMLTEYLIEMRNDDSGMKDCLLLKRKMIFYVWVGGTIFCFINCIQYGIINNLNDEFVLVKLQLFLESFNFISLGLILWICRPRK